MKVKDSRAAWRPAGRVRLGVASATLSQETPFTSWRQRPLAMLGEREVSRGPEDIRVPIPEAEEVPDPDMRTRSHWASNASH